ncbi:MAG: helix-turn-helix domain-containing protein [Eubacteriales bacterium]|jgi:putative transcriptional regulator
MIRYDPFYRTLLRQNMTEYQLIFKHGVSAHILHRMKHGKTITLKTLDTLCFILHCPVSDVIEYVEDPEEEKKPSG